MPKSLFKRHAIVALLLGALVAAAYAPIVRVPFLQDDFSVVRAVAQPGINAPAEFAYWWQILSNELGGFAQLSTYRPLYWLSFGLDYALYGTDPLGYHLTNLALHLISSFFVYLLALELVPGERRWWVAVTAGGIFALYPINPGAVTWPAGRVDTICAVFFLPTLLFFLRWLRTDRRRYLFLSLTTFALALFSKETAVVLPGLLFLCAIYRRKGFTNAVLGVMPFAAMLGIFLVIRYYMLLEVQTDYISAIPLNVISSLRGFLYLTLQMFVPLNHHLLPPGWEDLLRAVFSFWPIVVLAVLGMAAYYYFGKAKEKLPVLLFALYALPMAPVFHMFVPATETGVNNYAQTRWLYIPSAFMSIFIAYMLWAAFAEHRRLFLAATTVVCACFLAILVANNSVHVGAGETASELLESGKTPDSGLREG